jgi:hypothetical protein
VAIAAGPWIDGFEQRLVRGENVVVGEPVGGTKITESRFKAHHERRMLEPPDDRKVFFTDDVAQVSARREVPERIERHDLASLR